MHSGGANASILRAAGPFALQRLRAVAENTVIEHVLSIFQHVLSIILLIVCIVFVNWVFGTNRDQSHLTPVESYGATASVFLYLLRSIPYLSVPFAVTNIIGFVTMNLWPTGPKFQVPKTRIPFLCFRVVTRGLFPDLVKSNVNRNIEVCYKAGLDNFKFEVVTDNSLNLPKSALIRELVVPETYVTRNNSHFKARALQYCLQSDINILSDDDWIVHLDEETILTEGSVIGLANFAGQELGSIAQGVITYANEEVVNWWTTLADSVRVSVDLGMMRFCFKRLNCPAFGFKGSYIIVKVSVEKKIGFDFGPCGSIAEDVFFALTAWKLGYKFNFVDGEMWEKSPFSLGDYVKQRKRWFVGHIYTILSSEIPIKCKLCLIPTDLGWLLLFGNILNFPASFVFPIPMPLILNVIAGSMGGVMIFLFIFGTIKSISIRKYGLPRKVLFILWTVISIPLAACLDATASLYGVITCNSGGFHIVEKEVKPPSSYYKTNDSMVRTVMKKVGTVKYKVWTLKNTECQHIDNQGWERGEKCIENEEQGQDCEEQGRESQEYEDDCQGMGHDIKMLSG
ncbi:hypothetical protein CHS0354_014000 [Potamilus streckersoni]|uniref:Glycosyltransferase 2-like domain-containing protein n=1 Tax=Potamilus streckersoni TaxID=2493646 RepID=A0AAE0WFB4_9BIVA|nr:hypothetical protein CHS0354_014000 [Potamilus streckersoni]